MKGKDLDILITALKISVRKFEEQLGLNINRIQKSIERNSNVKDDVIESIIIHYPYVNKDWLFTGVGEIFINTENVAASSITKAPGSKRVNKKDDKADLIPYYEIDFMAGNSGEFYEDGTITPAYFMDIPEFKGCIAFRAYSDSMEELIKSGNILFATKIEDWKSHLEYGQIYGITMDDNRRYLKFIRSSAKPTDTFLLKSQNNSYDDFEIPKSKIKNIWLIEGWLNRRT